MPGKKGKKEKDEEQTPSTNQPPPPKYNDKDDEKDGKSPWCPPGHHGDHKHHEHSHKHHHEMDALEAIYFNLMETRRVVDKLVEESRQEKIRRRMEVVPVRVSDLMQGCQAAVARANRSVRAGEGEEEDIEQMSVKNLEISLSAPIIESAHAEEPTIMLPNIKSVDSESAKITLKFSIVSVPVKKRG
ncbi:MAG: hypothetical protein GY940_32810 [bacterium]|nr:hypothetical protein [bacterium]